MAEENLERQFRELKKLMTNAMLFDRSLLASRLGVSFNGQRDIYDSAGYKKGLLFADYYGAYRRQDIARRVVRLGPDETWRLAPDVLDGTTSDDAKQDSEFVRAWNRLAHGSKVGEKAETQQGLLHYLNRVDCVSGIGRYGVLLLGVRDGKSLEEPLEKGSLHGPEDLLYTASFDEGGAQIPQMVTDINDERFGKPAFYNLWTATTTMDATSQSTALMRRVHWSRCIHVAENLENNDTFGTPRLEACWNRVFDLLKVMAGAGEAAWKLLDAGHIMTTKPGGKLPTREADLTALEDQIEEFVHGLRRWLLAENLESTTMGGQMSDPTGLVMINVALIAAATGYPQRILFGSERGSLASTQDEVNLANVISTRQNNYAGPMLLRPLINRLIWAGILPMPNSGEFCFQWKPLFETKRLEGAQVADAAASAMQKAGVEIDPVEFATVYLPEVDASKVKAKQVAPTTMLAGQGAGDPANPGDPTLQDDRMTSDKMTSPVGNREGGKGDAFVSGFWRDYP